jgi:hypothetical protein
MFLFRVFANQFSFKGTVAWGCFLSTSNGLPSPLDLYTFAWAPNTNPMCACLFLANTSLIIVTLGCYWSEAQYFCHPLALFQRSTLKKCLGRVNNYLLVLIKVLFFKFYSAVCAAHSSHHHVLQYFSQQRSRQPGEFFYFKTVLEFLALSMGARNRVGIGVSYRPACLHRLAESIPWNRFLASLKV